MSPGGNRIICMIYFRRMFPVGWICSLQIDPAEPPTMASEELVYLSVDRSDRSLYVRDVKVLALKDKMGKRPQACNGNPFLYTPHR